MVTLFYVYLIVHVYPISYLHLYKKGKMIVLKVLVNFTLKQAVLFDIVFLLQDF